MAAGRLCDNLPGALGPVDLPALLKCSLALRELFLLTRPISHEDLSSAPCVQVSMTSPLSLLQVPPAPKSNLMSCPVFSFIQSTSPCPRACIPTARGLPSPFPAPRLCCAALPAQNALHSTLGLSEGVRSQCLQAALPTALSPGNLGPRYGQRHSREYCPPTLTTRT